jgi:hypothetical protein
LAKELCYLLLTKELNNILDITKEIGEEKRDRIVYNKKREKMS